MKKVHGEMQTLRACHSNVKPENFTPPQTPFPGAQEGQNLISWRWSLPSNTDPVPQFGENRCTQFRVIVVTDPHTKNARRPLQTHRQDR